MIWTNALACRKPRIPETLVSGALPILWGTYRTSVRV